MTRLFGTDGVRGVANETLTPELAFRVGRAAGLLLLREGRGGPVAIGRDTRRSGPMIGASLASGFCSVGIDAVALGVVPTGAVSAIVARRSMPMGAVVSASHNPAPDNGIKLIGPDGRKLPEEAERWIEKNLETAPEPRPVGAGVGRLTNDRSEVEGYLEWLQGLVPEGLNGLRVALDAGHGAAFEVAPALFRRLGAEVVAVGTEPDGMNINAEGGATKPQTVQSLTRATGATVGVAFDGDADRAVFSDSRGRLINGDRTMAIWCGHWRRHGRLDPALVVGTVMTNGGLERHMAAHGVSLERTDVGDRHVSALLRERGGRIGGEQSGHIIFPEHLPTGDGLVTALEILRVLKREGRTAAECFGDYEPWPQVLVNVAVGTKDGWRDRPAVAEALVEAEESLDGRGRINVRASGTQPLIRVMVEADEEDLRDRVADRVVASMIGDLGGEVYSRVDLTHALGD